MIRKIGFKAPKQLVILQKEEIIEQCSKVFQILYTKDIKKKLKIRFDGILLQEGNKVSFYDEGGKRIYVGYKNDMEALEDQQIFLGCYLVDLLKEINYEEFQSGRCFLINQTIQSIVSNVSKNNKVQITLLTSQTIPSEEFFLTDPKDKNLIPCKIDNFLNKQMRAHQRQGVKFLFETICGMKGSNINGAILADSMGLGKTLQAISLIWVLLKQNPFTDKKPFIRKVVIVAPLTLVPNWEKEINKWLGHIRLIPLVAIGTKEEVHKQVKYFLTSYYECLITSYETFRNVLSTQNFDSVIDLMIFDEGHRLKNMNIKIFQSIDKMTCKRRIILTGTPIQNNMKEFYACCAFVNPGIFQSYKMFKQIFGDPIEAGLSGSNSDLILQKVARERSKELSNIISKFILRRHADILEKFLPPKHEYQIFLGMTPLQKDIYKHIIKVSCSSKDKVFSLLTLMRKLLTHPDLLFTDQSDLSREFISRFPSDYQCNMESQSNKIIQLKQIIDRAVKYQEKVVVCSYYGQTLDVIQHYFQKWKVEFLRLDGSTMNKKRQGLIDQFSSPLNKIPVFLINGRSGGTGLNLQVANKIILMDVDWNPANDIQVMARIWREGQTKEVHIYRFVICGSFEEKILQRQLIKERLSSKIVDESDFIKKIKNEELRDLFTFQSDSKCLTYSEDQNDLISVKKDLSYDLAQCEDIKFLKINSTTKQNDNQEQEIPTNLFMDQQVFMNVEDETSQQDDETSKDSDDTSNESDHKSELMEPNLIQDDGQQPKQNQKIVFNIDLSDQIYQDSNSKLLLIMDESPLKFDKVF